MIRDIPAYQEAHVRADDHVERVAAELIRLSVKFTVKPEPNSWWRIRAWLPSTAYPARELLALIVAETLAVRA